MCDINYHHGQIDEETGKLQVDDPELFRFVLIMWGAMLIIGSLLTWWGMKG